MNRAVTVPDAKFTIAFSTMAYGNMLRTNNNRATALRSRRSFLADQHVSNDRVLLVRPSHSSNVDLLSRGERNILRRTFLQRPLVHADFDHFYDGADGILTLDNGVAIGLLSGDCVPLVIWEHASGLHGILHVGLLGALNDIVSAAAAVLLSLGIQPGAVNCYLGPCITQRNYNVSNSGLWTALRGQIFACVPGVERYVAEFDGCEFFDVPAMIVDRLVTLGFSETRIRRYDGCTGDVNSPFLSHHRQKTGGERGNFLSVIAPTES